MCPQKAHSQDDLLAISLAGGLETHTELERRLVMLKSRLHVRKSLFADPAVDSLEFVLPDRREYIYTFSQSSVLLMEIKDIKATNSSDEPVFLEQVFDRLERIHDYSLVDKSLRASTFSEITSKGWPTRDDA